MTNLILCNCYDMDSNSNNTPYFKNISSQYNWFLKRKVLVIEDGTYHRKNTDIKVSYTLEQLKLCNYILTQNDKGKIEYYFIMDKQYINEKTTMLYLKMDIIQTYLFDFQILDAFIDRQHVPEYFKDGTPRKRYIDTDEGLEVGEYEIKNKWTVYDYQKKGSYIITARDRLGKIIPTSTGSGSGSGSTGAGDTTIVDKEYPYNTSITAQANSRFSRVWKGVKSGQTHNLFPSVTYAQYVLECGWSGSTLSENYNNAFGIKADSSWTGEKVALTTWEDYGNGPVEIVDYFRVYSDINQSVKDRTQFLLENSNYANAGVFTATTPEQQCYALKSAGYATDPAYPTKLIEIINSNNFKIYDK